MALAKESKDLLLESVRFYKTTLMTPCDKESSNEEGQIERMRKIVALHDLEKGLVKMSE